MSNRFFRAVLWCSITMNAVPDEYTQLLDATIHHLESLKEQGTRFVSVSPETLAALVSGARKVVPTAAPASPQAPVSVRPASSKNASSYEPSVVAAPLAKSEAIVATPVITSSDPAKLAAFSELRERAMACVKCPNLASSRKN